ncbi:N-acetylglucosamine-6-phosphate deacetylase [Tissierella sp. MSJ-40]|uniref:N-acetylglucosamine-6-phosphate deacetylase n=1 Tax=Tissierella simiarum TaxID=2841534 RepID=A0ABS6E1R2_9FIRM|nr:N-acetylglucosamine-6-phosphate deacetylase [Tissierella simiarum]MBU5436845.1 N-acetylglucosamine-6-phosphate deacetylase [Tissierella simiarum]
MSKYIIRGNKIFTPDSIMSGGIIVNEKTIEKIIQEDDINKYRELPVIELKDSMIIPGLIDIHIHGSGGWSTSVANKNHIEGLCKYLPSVGVTSYQPTLGGEETDEIGKILETIGAVIEDDYEGARILGIHMEGPFLNPKKKGAFIVENLKEPSIELMESFIEKSKNNISHVTIAPELKHSHNLIKLLVEKNILVSGGHTNATIEETKEAIDQGISLSNHTCNAQSSIHHREPGALGGYLLDDRVYCELICDLFHVHPDMIKIIIKMKSTDKICMISDAIIGSGLKPGKYEFSERVIIIDDEGWSRLSDGTIAGSTKNLLFGFKNMVTNLGLPIEEVVKMSSYIPAKLARIEDKKGSIEEGKDADIVILDKDFNVLMTFVEGKLCFASTKEEVFLNEDI